MAALPAKAYQGALPEGGGVLPLPCASCVPKPRASSSARVVRPNVTGRDQRRARPRRTGAVAVVVRRRRVGVGGTTSGAAPSGGCIRAGSARERGALRDGLSAMPGGPGAARGAGGVVSAGSRSVGRSRSGATGREIGARRDEEPAGVERRLRVSLVAWASGRETRPVRARLPVRASCCSIRTYLPPVARPSPTCTLAPAGGGPSSIAEPWLLVQRTIL